MTQPSEPSNDSANPGVETSAGDAGDESTPPKGVELSVDQLSPEALRGLIEEYITREGTDYGYSGGAQGAAADPHAEWSLEEKVDQVLRQLENGDARIVFDLEQESASIVPADALYTHLAGVD